MTEFSFLGELSLLVLMQGRNIHFSQVRFAIVFVNFSLSGEMVMLCDVFFREAC